MSNDFRPGSLKAQTAATALGGVGMVFLCLATGSSLMGAPDAVTFGLIGVALLACVGSVAAYVAGRPRGGVGAPTSSAGRREKAQWQRWQNCLFTWPVVMTNYALLAVSSARAWEKDHSQPLGVAFALLLPLVVVAMMAQILPLRRGVRGSAQRRQYDELADELSRAHALQAFRSGYFAFLVGALASLAVAYFAREWIGMALIWAVWLGFVVPCVHFGLLQRLAEGGED